MSPLDKERERTIEKTDKTICILFSAEFTVTEAGEVRGEPFISLHTDMHPQRHEESGLVEGPHAHARSAHYLHEMRAKEVL